MPRGQQDPLHRGIQHPIHGGHLCVIKISPAGKEGGREAGTGWVASPTPVTLRLSFALCSLFLGAGGQVAGGRALTFGLLEQGGDAVRVYMGVWRSSHQWQEEGLECGVEGLQQSEGAAQALDGHVCGT